MKLSIASIIFILCLSCSKDNETTKEQPIEVKYSTLGRNLIETKFLMYADSTNIDSLTDQIEKSFYIYDTRNFKFINVDAEELAEFQFSFFLPQLNVILNKRNFHLDIKTADKHETSHEVFLNGEKIQLYTKEELEKADFWDKASRTFFKKLNELLKRRNFDESFFLLYNGNDLSALLLTNKQFEIIEKKYKNEPKEIPYRP